MLLHNKTVKTINSEDVLSYYILEISIRVYEHSMHMQEVSENYEYWTDGSCSKAKFRKSKAATNGFLQS